MELIEAAGGIVERTTPEGQLIAIVYRERHGPEWGLPKGKRRQSESWRETALREVTEEIGFSPIMENLAGATTYDANHTPKLVLYWRMRAVGEIPTFLPNEDKEVLSLLWLPPETAIGQLSHNEDKDLIRRTFFIHNRAPQSRLVDRLAKWLVPIVRRRPWKRLRSAIKGYEEELRARTTLRAAPKPNFQPSLNLLTHANIALEDGDIDQGWRLLLAQRVEILQMAEPATVAPEIANEALKLNPWRKAAITELLTQRNGKPIDRQDVFRASLLLHEHFHNEAYKDGLRRGNALRLAILMTVVLIAIFWLGYSGHLADVASLKADSPTEDWRSVLATIGTIGLLGAIVSAITNLPTAEASARIPEMASSFRVMILRLFMGPASAIVLYFVIRSSFAQSIVKVDRLDGYAILVIAFVAGFSERFVLRVIERIAPDRARAR